jgi:thioesterase domain-containing protein
VREIAAEYIRQLETEYPNGPVLLGGYCGGCIITLEMAAQLAEKGRPVLQMVLFDPGGIPRNVLDNFRRNLARQRGEPEERERGLRWIKQQLRYIRHLLAVGRWTDGTLDDDFADERLRSFRERRMSVKVWYDQMRGGRRERDIEDNLSNAARVKMFVAFQHYKLRKFEGPVTVYCSEELSHYFESDKAMWVHLLPNRTLHVLGETHDDVIHAQAATGAKLMQDVFDRALAAR